MASLKMPSRSPLHGAVLRGELYTVKQLVWSRPDLVHQLDGKRRNPFILAVEKNQIEIAGFLVGQFPGLVESRGGRHNRTALHMVSHRGQHRLLQFLLQLGSSELEAKDRQGRTPVMLAVLARRMDVLAMLLHAGASLEARDWHGNRALHLASRCSGVHVCRRLVEMGCELEIENEEVQTPLHVAAMAGQTDTCRFLLEQGLEATAVDHGRMTALHHAVASAQGPGQLSTVRALLAWGGARLALMRDGQGRMAEDYTEGAKERGDEVGREMDAMLREVTRTYTREQREAARAKARRDAEACKSTRHINRAAACRVRASRAKLQDMAREPHWVPLPPIKYRPPPHPLEKDEEQEPETDVEEDEEERQEQARRKREEKESRLLRAAEGLLLRVRSLPPAGKVRRHLLASKSSSGSICSSSEAVQAA